MSRVLVVYTGGTIGMQNTPQHGYLPVKGFISRTLASMLRFHSREMDGVSPMDSEAVLAAAETNDAHVTLFGHGEHVAEDVRAEALRQPDVGVINGTVVRRVRLPALVSPPSLYGKRIKYSILEYDPLLDSSNMTMSDWVKIATDIEVNYRLFDAFIVLHGTDTMAYTASALSFMLEDLGKTVIITGSQVPLAEVRNDAVDNLLGALTIAGHFVIPEVGLFFDNRLFRGNRSSKVNAVDFNAFDSPNLRPLVNVGINIDVSWIDIWRPKRIAQFRTFKAMNPSVAALRMFPGITEATVRAFLSPPIAGVVLETYGAGNAPSNRPELLAALKEACDRGVVIVNCTQCKRGLVSDIYETGRALTNIGIVPGADMTPECALTKLSYLLAKYPDPAICRRLMRRNMRGELTVPMRRPRFTYLPHPGQLYPGPPQGGVVASVLSLLGVNLGMATPTLDSVASAHPEGAHIESNAEDSGTDDITTSLERALIPLLLCQAARANDTTGLRAVLQEYEYMVNVPDYDGRVPLHIAASENRRACAELLLLNGANLHIRDHFGHSPLFDAVRAGHAEIVALLRKAGGHFAAEEEEEVTSMAVAADHAAIVQLIIDAAVNIKRSQSLGGAADTSNQPSAPLQMPDVAMTRTLSGSALPYSARVTLDPVDSWGRTPLDDAERLGRASLTEMLRAGHAALAQIGA
nr:hypothetical protein HK105_006440 [Polyrhizophydium stewartii]